MLEDTIRSIIKAAMCETLRELLPQIREAAKTDGGDDEMLSLHDAAARAKISDATVRRLCDQGKLRRYGTGRLARVRFSDLLSALASMSDSAGRVPNVDDAAIDILSRKKRG